MSKSSIPYGDETLPVVTGCSGVDDNGKVLACRGRCWAMNLAHRFNPIGTPAGDFTPTFHPEVLERIFHWRRPRRVLVSFTGDLFDRMITDAQIASVFGVMAAAPQHTFILLTKQAARMERWFQSERAQHVYDWRMEHPVACRREWLSSDPAPWPLTNMILGVSVSNQPDVDVRVNHLMRCPAATRWVSWEPAISAVDFTRIRNAGEVFAPFNALRRWTDGKTSTGIDWVVCAAETGERARPLDLDAVRRVRDDCAAAGVKFMLKNQTGFVALDGRTHEEMP